MEILTPRLKLREFLDSDWVAVHAYQNDPRYLKFYTWEARSPQEVQQFVSRFIGWQAEMPRLMFPARHHAGLKMACLIGNCGIRKIQLQEDEAEIGFELAPEHWGKGYATEAARAMLNYGFTALDLKRGLSHLPGRKPCFCPCVGENRDAPGTITTTES